MVGDETDDQQNGDASSIFVVRLREGDDAAFAVCERVGTVPGDRRLPGMGRTVAELVNEQALMAAAITAGDEDSLRDLPTMMQSSENRSGNSDE